MTNISEYYDESCKNSKFGWQAACWESEDDQYGRFVIASSIIKEDSSILDVGCGQGDFYNFLTQRYKNLNYFGIDISNEMIKTARIKNPKINFENIDLLNLNIQADYVFALGTFNLKIDNQLDYIKRNIEKCYEICNKRLCIVLTSDLAKGKCPDIYFYNPEKIINITTSLCDKIILNTASIPGEIVLYMIKS